MQFENKSYKSETIRELRKEQKEMGIENPIVNGGFPTFNTCGHTTIDMSNILMDESNGKMHTLSIKVADDVYVTMCVMQVNDGNYINIDTQMHTTNEKRVQKAIHFPKLINNSHHDGETIRVDNLNLLALISEVKNK